MEPEPAGSSLVVRGVEPGDEGLYTCQVSAATPTLLRHRVRVRTRPAIQAEQAPRLAASQAGRATLTCAVLAGRPEPQLRWLRREGEVVGEGRRLVLDDLTRWDAGMYTCEADNGFGEVALSSVQLLVNCKLVFWL